MRQLSIKVDNDASANGKLPASEWNDFLKEIENVITLAGLTLDPASVSQLYDAVQTIASELVSSGTAGNSAQLDGKSLNEVRDYIISAVVAGADTAYDTLIELQNAIQNNDGDISGILATLSHKANEYGDSAKEFAVAPPTDPEHAVPKAYVDASDVGEVDLNTLTTPREYYQPTSTNVTGENNYPLWATSAGKLSVTSLGGDWVLQLYTEYGNTRSISSRYYNGADWSDWKSLGGETIFYSGSDIDELDARLSEGDMYGDTTPSVFSLYYTIQRSADSITVALSFVVKFDAKTLPSSDRFSFKYNVLARLQDVIPELTSISDVMTRAINVEIVRDDNGNSKYAVMGQGKVECHEGDGNWHFFNTDSNDLYDGNRENISAYALRFRTGDITVKGAF